MASSRTRADPVESGPRAGVPATSLSLKLIGQNRALPTRCPRPAAPSAATHAMAVPSVRHTFHTVGVECEAGAA